MDSPISRRTWNILAALLAITFVVFSARQASAFLRETRESHSWRSLPVTVNATGKGNAEAAVAKMLLTFRSSAANPAEAVKKQKAFPEALAKLGIETKDVKVLSYNLNSYPTFDENGKERPNAELSQQLEVSVREMSKVPGVIAAAVESGVTTIDSVTMALEDQEAGLAEARADGLKKARAKIEEIAKSTGRKVSRMSSYSEYPTTAGYGGYGSGPMNIGLGTLDPTGGSVGIPAPMEQEVTLGLTVSYELE